VAGVPRGDRGALVIAFRPLAAGWPALGDHHRHLVEDSARTGAFMEAIERQVRPGDVVCELGAGTGILSVAAARAGAGRVHALEVGPIVEVARDVVADAGLANRIVFEEPDAADLIISECMGPLAVGGTMIEAVVLLRQRILRAGGAIIPRTIRVWLAPVSSPESDEYVRFWEQPRHGVDLRAAARLAIHNLYQATFAPRDVVAPAAIAREIDLTAGPYAPRFQTPLVFAAAREAIVHGFAGWFDVDLGAGVTLDTSPADTPTVWQQVFLPIARPVRVSAGERLEIVFGATPAIARAHVVYFDWKVTMGGETFHHSTRHSYPRGVVP
jgi:hypothetical protein